jgi:uncharacterized protein YodC (DUF2158 family)
MKHNYTNTQLQAAIDEACNKINEEHKDVGGLLILDPEDNRWRNEAPSRLSLIKAALASLPEPMDEESMLLNLLAVIHRDGGHYQAEHGTRKAVEDACKEWQRLILLVEKARLTEPKQSLSQLRPLAEAGEVPEGCVRVTGWLEDEDWILGSFTNKKDTHFADIQLLAAKAKCLFCEGSGFEEEDHGHYPCRSGCKPSVKAAHADEPTPEPLVTKPISLPEWTPQVGDVVTLKSGGPKMTVMQDMGPKFLCAYDYHGEVKTVSISTNCLQSA